MTRFLSLVAFLFVLMVVVGAVMLYLVYGMDNTLPSDIYAAPVSSATVLEWHDEYVSIDAPDVSSLYAALGTAHGVRRAWTINLWRQVALGRVSEWYGSSAAALDSLALQLGLARSARQAYRSLPDEQRNLLEAYSAGVNIAMSRRGTRLADEFTVLRVTPDEWEPWHSLALERLFAWLAVPAMPDSVLRDVPQQVLDLVERSAHLEEFLAIHDLEHSTAFTTGGSQPTLGVRFVYGSEVLPPLEEHVVTYGGERRVMAVLPGTPFPFLAAGESGAFVLLPRNEASLRTSLADTLEMTPSHERISDRQGREYVVSFMRGPASLLLGDQMTEVHADTISVSAASADTLAEADTLYQTRRQMQRWLLDWHGLDGPSDAASFHQVLLGQSPPFSLFQGGWISVRDGTVTSDAREEAIAERDGVWAVGHPDWIDGIATRLAYVQDNLDSLGTSSVLEDVHSMWAEQRAPTLVRSASAVPDPPPLVRDALMYLRNWNYEYDASNIAATIFDFWMDAYRDSTGAYPESTEADTLYAERLLRYTLLSQTVDSLAARYGTEMSQWRWERIQPDLRHTAGFPSSASIVTVRNRRYDPIELPGRGHPSALRFGTTPLEDTPAGSAAWSASIPLLQPDAITLQRRRIDIHSFRGRYMISERDPTPVAIEPGGSERQTVLHPSAEASSE